MSVACWNYCSEVKLKIRYVHGGRILWTILPFFHMINHEKCFIMHYQDEKFWVLTKIMNLFKGQLISKCLFGVFVWTKKNNELFSMISALASKKWLNQKLYYTNCVKFWFDLFLEARAEILKEKFVGFLVEMIAPKRHFEINWPLS